MESEKIQNFLLSNGRYLPMNEISTLSRKLQLIRDEGLIFRLFSITFKNPTTFTLLYWLCPGFAFIDRFFIGSIFSGLLKALMPLIFLIVTLSLSGLETDPFSPSMIFIIPWVIIIIYIIWILVDGFTVGGRVRSYNMDKIYGITEFNSRRKNLKPEQTDSEWECIHCGYRQIDSFIYCPKCKLDDDGLLRKS